MCSSSPDIPDPSPALIFQAQAQAQLGNRYLDMQDQLMNYYKDRQQKVDAVSQQVIDQQMALAQQTADQGTDLYNYQKDVFRPVEQSLVADAMRTSTPAAYEKYAQEAVAQVASANANASGQAQRALTSMGVNPNSGAFAAGQRGIQLSNAAALGSVANTARDQAENLSFARRADVAGLGKGLVGAGNASYGLTQSGLNSASSAANQASQTAGATIGTPTQYGALGVQAGANAGNLYADIYKTQMQGYAASMNQSDPLASALGTGIGAFAATKDW